MTTPQAGAYDDIVKTAEKNGIPVATTNSFDGGIHNRLWHQPHRPGRVGGGNRRRCAGASALLDKGVEKGSIMFPSDTAMGNIEVNNRVTVGLQRHRCRPEGCRQARQLQGRCRSRECRRARRHERSGQQHHRIDRVSAATWSARLPANNVFTPALVKAVAQLKMGGKICAYGFDLGPRPAGRHEERRPHRRARPTALHPGLLAGHAALPADRPRHFGGQSSTRAPNW